MFVPKLSFAYLLNVPLPFLKSSSPLLETEEFPRVGVTEKRPASGAALRADVLDLLSSH